MPTIPVGRMIEAFDETGKLTIAALRSSAAARGANKWASDACADMKRRAADLAQSLQKATGEFLDAALTESVLLFGDDGSRRKTAQAEEKARAQIIRVSELTDTVRDGVQAATASTEELATWLQTLSTQLGVNIEAAEAMRAEPEVEAALSQGEEIWNWLEGKGSHATSEPELFQRALGSAKKYLPISDTSMVKACAELSESLAITKQIAMATHASLKALKDA